MKNLEQAYVQLIEKILKSKKRLEIEDIIELRNVRVQFNFNNIENIFCNKRIYEDYLEMKKVFNTQEPNKFGHNYSNVIIGPKGNNIEPINQIIDLLKTNINSKNAVLTFLPYDKIPCLNIIQFLVRNGKLETTYYSRSQDIYKKFPLDALCIKDYTEKISSALDIKINKIVANITSAHIYKQDENLAKEYIQKA